MAASKDTQIVIPVKSLKDFFTRCSHVKESTLLPIYEYFKLEVTKDVVTATMFNGQCFVVFPLEDCVYKKPETILLNTQYIKVCVQFARSENITLDIVRTEGKPPIVKFTDGAVPGEFQSANETEFGNINTAAEDKPIEIEQDMLDAIFIASKHTHEPYNPNFWLSYVHLKAGKKNYVFASGGGYCYSKHFKKPLPTIVLEPDVAFVIGGFSAASYNKVGNYDVFNTGNTIYGFLQPVPIQGDFEGVLKNLDTTKHFIVNKSDLIDLCRRAIGMNKKMALPPELVVTDGVKKKINLSLNSVDQSLQLYPEIDAEKVGGKVDKGMLSPKHLLIVLENIQGEKVQFNGPISGHYYLTCDEDKNYLGTITQISYNTAPKTEVS